MRLLNTTTYELRFFIGGQIPQYAILSHTWGEDEFVFEDLKTPIVDQLANPKRGLVKVLKTCELARKDGLQYAWVDTCCIDKSSSAELSEAINSMFRWYRRASMCYVWLEDVTLEDDKAYGFASSKWFRRGWTLQELIGPHDVMFYDSSWELIADRYSLAEGISLMTKINMDILLRRHLPPGERIASCLVDGDNCPCCYAWDGLEANLWTVPVAVRMSWASGRLTTRAEDRAYCLLGLFDVNMPLLYGEGDKAFKRLLSEMLQNDTDSSILLWRQRRVSDFDYMPCLPAPLFAGDYAMDLPLYRNPQWPQPEIIPTPRGLSVAVWLAPPCALSFSKEYEKMTRHWQLAVLSPTADEDRFTAVGIFVKQVTFFGETETIYTRAAPYTMVTIKKETASGFGVATFRLRNPDEQSRGGFLAITSQLEHTAYIHPSNFHMDRITLTLAQSSSAESRRSATMRVDARNCPGYAITQVYPPLENLSDQHASILTFENNAHAFEAVVLAFTSPDLSSGFFVLWRGGDSPDDAVVTVTAWPTLAGRQPTPADSKHNLEDVWWLFRMQDQLRRNQDPFSTLAAMKPEKGMSRTICLLPALTVRAMIIPESFIGIERFLLLVEVGPRVPETAKAWEKQGLKV